MRSKFFYQPSYSPPSYSIALVKILKEGSITRITADADNMSRTNVDNSGKVERFPISLDSNIPSLKVEKIGQFEQILGFRCKVWSLINAKTNSEISKLWITTEIKNSNFDQFVELFNFANTLFPCKSIQGWILKREDYRREGKIFVTEAKEVKSRKIECFGYVN